MIPQLVFAGVHLAKWGIDKLNAGSLYCANDKCRKRISGTYYTLNCCANPLCPGCMVLWSEKCRDRCVFCDKRRN